MAVPRFYHTDRLRLGTLSGQYDGLYNPVLRVADGSITIAYAATSGATPTGVFQTTIGSGQAAAQNPTHFVIPRGTPTLSGYRILVVSEDLDGSNSATRLDETVTSGVQSLVYALSGTATARRVWRITISGTGGMLPLELFEAMLADEYVLPRSPQVGVPRSRVRQFSRIPLPGTQAFVKRDGPVLRAVSYPTVLISGTETDNFHAFVEAIDGGQPVYHIDDLGSGYFAEVVGNEVAEDDEAGIYTLDLQVLEIRVD